MRLVDHFRNVLNALDPMLPDIPERLVHSLNLDPDTDVDWLYEALVDD